MNLSTENVIQAQVELLHQKKEDTLNDISFLQHLTDLEEEQVKDMTQALSPLSAKVDHIKTDIEAIKSQIKRIDELELTAAQIEDKSRRLYQLVDNLKVKVSMIYFFCDSCESRAP